MQQNNLKASDTSKLSAKTPHSNSLKLTNEELMSDNPISKKIKEKADSTKKKNKFLDFFRPKN
jgi:hypothetical protein